MPINIMTKNSEDINEHILHLTGDASLPEALKKSKEYKLELNAGVYSVEQRDKQDGTYDVHYKAKLITAEILKESGDYKPLKIKGSQSDKWRRQVYAIWLENYATQFDDEEFYQLIMNLLRKYGDRIVPYLLKLKDE